MKKIATMYSIINDCLTLIYYVLFHNRLFLITFFPKITYEMVENKRIDILFLKWWFSGYSTHLVHVSFFIHG